MEMMSLFEWAKRHRMSYSMATKLFERGQLEGAVREGRYTRVPVATLPPEQERVACMICKAQVRQVTNTHLKTHNLSSEQYRKAFPFAPLTAEDVTDQIAASLTGIKRSEGTRAKVSANRAGVIPKNHPRHVKGTYRISEEAKRKMSEAKLGRKLSEEHKRAIGDGLRGRVLSPEQVAKMSAQRKGQPSPLKGRKFDTNPRKAIAVWVEADLAYAVKEVAAARGITMSTFVANLIRREFKKARIAANPVT